jgi:hypothetical protein
VHGGIQRRGKDIYIMHCIVFIGISRDPDVSDKKH